MARLVLLIADADDPLGRALQARLPAVTLCTTPAAVPFSFTLGRDGRVCDAGLQVDGSWRSWNDFGGLVFRPGRTWSLPRRPRSTQQVFACHEWSTAWCALLSAFPAPVVDRLPAGWFLDQRRQQDSWTDSLSTALDVACALGRRPDASAFVVGTHVLAARDRADELAKASRAWRAWLRRRRPALARWQHGDGLRCMRVDAVRLSDGWALCRVDPVPAADAMARPQLAAWARALCGLLQA